MTYDDIAAVFLAPLTEPIAEPDVAATPARRLTPGARGSGRRGLIQ